MITTISPFRNKYALYINGVIVAIAKSPSRLARLATAIRSK
jgi:hypothetical protein